MSLVPFSLFFTTIFPGVLPMSVTSVAFIEHFLETHSHLLISTRDSPQYRNHSGVSLFVCMCIYWMTLKLPPCTCS